VRLAEWALDQLRHRYGLRVRAPAKRLEELRAGVEERTIAQITTAGLHEFLDWVQRMLIAVAGEVGTALFRDWAPLAEAQGKG
jgi:hypothetical protein